MIITHQISCINKNTCYSSVLTFPSLPLPPEENADGSKKAGRVCTYSKAVTIRASRNYLS